MSYSYEALDRTHCIINTIQVNLVEHKFYSESEEYKDLINQAVYLLTEAYQVVDKKLDIEEVSL